MSLLLFFCITSSAHAEIIVKDVIGRTVKLDHPAKRLLIDDGRYLLALSLLTKDPVSLLSAWPHDINRLGKDTYKEYLKAFPKIETLKKAPSSAGEFSLEQVLDAKPDLAVFSMVSKPSDQQIAQIESAGIAVVIIDFMIKPMVNIERSLLLLGIMTGHKTEAEIFLKFRSKKIAAIAKHLRDLSERERQRVFLEVHAAVGGDCCNSPGIGSMNKLIEFAGGSNIGAALINRAYGKISFEYVLQSKPDIYIATGGAHMQGRGGLLIGRNYKVTTARKTLSNLKDRADMAGLPAVANHKVYGIAQSLFYSPLNVIALELFAKWIQPERTQDINPVDTLNTINKKFLAIPLSGTYWVELN